MERRIDGTAEIAKSGFPFWCDDRATGVKSLFRRAGREQLCVRLDERRRERERVARELHDSLLQGLLSVNLHLQAAVGYVPADSPCRAALEHVIVRTQHVIDETRDILCGLHSPASGLGSFEQALSCVMDEFGPGGGAAFRMLVTGQRKPLGKITREQIYLIGREALINAIRHSEATSIEAELEYGPGWLRLRVRDNGRGIDPETVRSGRRAHWGLAGMRERAAAIGAQLRIRSCVGDGTEVQVWVPDRAPAEA